MYSLSKTENLVLETLKSKQIYEFTPGVISKLLGVTKEKVYNIIKSLNRKKQIYKVKNGLYIFGNEAFSFENLTKMYSPCYVSLWSALSYYKMTEQVPMKLHLITVKKARGIEHIWLHNINKELFCGYNNVGFPIASKEKMVFDFLWFNAITIKTLKEAITNEKLNIILLKNYVMKIPSKKRKVEMINKFKLIGVKL
jgi:predicted transcriptional regulator of viral defense system